jgi:uncharacterized protein with NRDE domain
MRAPRESVIAWFTMCTVLILRQAHPEWPLIVAANRDERYDRPAEGPQILRQTPLTVGGLDLERRGTWMGVTAQGFVVALTNQRSSANLMHSPLSRGDVVLKALEAGSQEGVENYLAGLDARAYRPFNLLFGDATVLRVAYARPDQARLRVEDVPPGVHVLPNDVLDSPVLPKAARALVLAQKAAHRPWPETVEALRAALADHVLPETVPMLLPEEADSPELRALIRRYQALCIHTESYGTRSSAILALAPGRVGHYLATDAASCQAPFRDVTGLLKAPPSGISAPVRP